MNLSFVKDLATRSPAVKRAVVRLLQRIPKLDIWLRAALNRELFRPSPLEVDARHLPESALDIYQELRATARKTRAQ